MVANDRNGGSSPTSNPLEKNKVVIGRIRQVNSDLDGAQCALANAISKIDSATKGLPPVNVIHFNVAPHVFVRDDDLKHLYRRRGLIDELIVRGCLLLLLCNGRLRYLRGSLLAAVAVKRTVKGELFGVINSSTPYPSQPSEPFCWYETFVPVVGSESSTNIGFSESPSRKTSSFSVSTVAPSGRIE